MNILYENTLIKSVTSVFEEMDQHQLHLVIKQAIEIIQSFLTLLPPMVVDCYPCPDLDSGAYPGKKIAGSAEDCVTTLSALFYSCEGESVAKTGEYTSTASIRKDVRTQMFSGHYPLTSLHENRKEFTHTLYMAPKVINISSGECTV